MGIDSKHNCFLEGQDAISHEAARAWMSSGAAGGDVTGVETLKQSHHRGVWRLLGAGPEGRNVCVKRGWKDDLELEHRVYQELLPKLGLPALRCHGLLEDPHPKRWWLFVEDAGEARYDRRNPGHVAALSDWLGMLHGAGQHLSGHGLPRRGPAHYLDVLREGRARILAHLDNPAIAPETVMMLHEVIALEIQLEDRWDEVERFCVGFPETLIHGDIKPKNLRMRSDGDMPPIYVFDWEMAGWGVPAPDLEGDVDSARYLRARSERGSPIEIQRLQRLALVGRLLRALAAVEWASQWLASEWVSEPVGQLRIYRDLLAQLIRNEVWLY